MDEACIAFAAFLKALGDGKSSFWYTILDEDDHHDTSERRQDARRWMVGLILHLRTNLRLVWYMAILKKCGLIEERVNKSGEKRIEVKRLKWKNFFDRFGIDAEVEQVKVKETTARCSFVQIGVKPREGRVKNAGQQLKANEILPPRHEHICSLWRKLSRELGESIPGAIAQEEGRDVADSDSDQESDADDGSFFDESDFEIDTLGSTAACKN